MKLSVFSALLVFVCLPFLAIAQDDCCCCDFRQKGQTEYNVGRYKTALQQWERGQRCSDASQCPDLANLIAKARAKVKQRDQEAAAAERQRQTQAAELQRLRNKADDDLWDVLKDGTAADCDKYLAKYPTGRHAAAAKQRKARFSPQTPVTTPPPKTAGPMVLVDGGTFQMGDQFAEGGTHERPVHTVTVGSFYISRYEVTFEEFDAFCSATGRDKPGDEGWGRGRRPVINVDWYDAVEYCNWRSQQENLTPVYTINKVAQDPNNQNTSDTKKWKITADWNANGYRLPTEAEWEYAARQRGQKVRFGNGRDIIDPFEINFNASAAYKKPYFIVGEYRQKTVPVDDLSANSLGLKHMSGNVWEWCWDWYDASFYANSDGARNPAGATAGQFRVLRGGSWDVGPFHCRAAFRFGRDRYDDVGFRVVRHL